MEVVGKAVGGTGGETANKSRGEGTEGTGEAVLEDRVASNEDKGWLPADGGREKSNGDAGPRRQTHLAVSFGSSVKEHLTNSMHQSQVSSFRGDRVDSSGKLTTTYSTKNAIKVQVPIAKVRELLGVELTASGELQSVSWCASCKRRGSKAGRAILFI